ncbi:MAG: hypothetical protein M3328_11090, partial [Chloroflexota bacterium]|nr:hypothetical protein [Chloroflexota bacterium]
LMLVMGRVRFRVGWVLVAFLCQGLVFGLAPGVGAAGPAWPGEWQADSSFYQVWSRADGPVAGGAVARSWLWGPVPFAVANEQYAESSTGQRLVEYMDKARMEVNDPSLDRQSPWFVTSGLLVYEMVTGQMQTGNSRFESRLPAELPVAGDAASPDAPTYATFARNTGAAPKAAGGVVQDRIGKDGTISRINNAPGIPADAKLFGFAYYDEVSKHNVPAVFAEWMRQSGKVLENGRLLQAPLLDPVYVLGRPVTEPYWADVLVGGAPARVLVQLYERRALTYNPGNAPEWRVEMANVGRAYYDWRYKSAPPEPAVAASLGTGGLTVRGWNWPANGAVRVQADLAGAESPLSGPQDAQADGSGRFSVVLPLNPEQQGALAAGGNVQVKARSGSSLAALPVAGRGAVGKVQVEGVLTQVGGQGLQMRARDGKLLSLVMDASSKVQYSEGDTATPAVLRAGIGASVEGMQSGSSVSVLTMKLLSLSKTGAAFGYTLQADGKSVRVSGTGWPGEANINFTIARLNGAGAALGSVRSDSRGNITAVLKLPAGAALGEGPLWLSASLSDKGSVLAQVAVPVDLPSAPAVGSAPPQLSVTATSGEQLGGMGSYCWQGVCADAIGVPLPTNALVVKPGEVLGLRSQYGPDPQMGLSPVSFSAQIYGYQDSTPGSAVYFTPSSQPVHSTGE